MNKIEEFAVDCAVELLGEDKQTLIDAIDSDLSQVGPEIIVFIQLIMDMVLEIIQNCPERSEEKVAKTMKSPNLIQRVIFVRLARKKKAEYEGVITQSPWELTKCCQDVVKSKPDEFVVDVIKTVQKKTNYWLI